MDGYSIGEVCRLLGIKPHILRYWERELEFLNPGKDDGGRRRYSPDDLQLLFRIRHLVNERRLTLEGVKLTVWEDLRTGSDSPLAELRSLRRELLKIERVVSAQRNILEKFSTESKSSDIQK